MAKKVNCIQLGANCGRTESDMVWIYCQKENWNCIFVEPLSASFESLKSYYAQAESGRGTHAFENCAIIPDIQMRDDDGNVSLYFSSIPRQSVMASLLTGHRPENKLSELVPALTLDELIDKYNMRNIHFDILQIDIEGFDADILLGTDFETIKPKYIRYESIHIPPHVQMEVTSHLSKFGYEAVNDKFWVTYEKTLNEEIPEVWEVESPTMNTVFERKG